MITLNFALESVLYEKTIVEIEVPDFRPIDTNFLYKPVARKDDVHYVVFAKVLTTDIIDVEYTSYMN